MLHYVAKQGHYSSDFIRLLRWGEYPELTRCILNAITSALFFKIYIYLMWTIFKFFTEFVIILLLFYIFGHKACGILAP